MLRGGRVVLAVRDVGRSVRFFVETLGMKLVSRHGDDAVMDAGDGFEIAITRGAPPAGAGGARIGLGTKLPLLEAVSVLENRGIVLVRAGETASFEGPDGYSFFLYPVSAGVTA